MGSGLLFPFSIYIKVYKSTQKKGDTINLAFPLPRKCESVLPWGRIRLVTYKWFLSGSRSYPPLMHLSSRRKRERTVPHEKSVLGIAHRKILIQLAVYFSLKNPRANKRWWCLTLKDHSPCAKMGSLFQPRVDFVSLWEKFSIYQGNPNVCSCMM